MGPRPSTQKKHDLFRQRLDELINPRYPLAQLAQHIDWSVFEQQWADLFPSSRGRPATAPHLVAGLLYLQHTVAISDEDVVWGWVENPLLAVILWRNLVPAQLTLTRAHLPAGDSESVKKAISGLMGQGFSTGEAGGGLCRQRGGRTKVSIGTRLIPLS